MNNQAYSLQTHRYVQGIREQVKALGNNPASKQLGKHVAAMQHDPASMQKHMTELQATLKHEYTRGGVGKKEMEAFKHSLGQLNKINQGFQSQGNPEPQHDPRPQPQQQTPNLPPRPQPPRPSSVTQGAMRNIRPNF